MRNKEISVLVNLSKKLSNEEFIFLIQNGNENFIQMLTEILYNCTHNKDIFNLMAKKKKFKQLRYYNRI